jgi:hypothetical protein
MTSAEGMTVTSSPLHGLVTADLQNDGEFAADHLQRFMARS